MPFRLQTFICQSLIFIKMCALVIVGWICAQQVWQDLTLIENSKNRVAITKQAAENLLLLARALEHPKPVEADLTLAKEKIEEAIQRMRSLALNRKEWFVEDTDRFSEPEEVRRARELQLLLTSILSSALRLNKEKATNPESALRFFRRDIDNNFRPRLRTVVDNGVSNDHARIQASVTNAFETVKFFGIIVVALAALTMIGHALSGYLHRSLVGPLTELSDSVERLTEDDHDIEIKRTSFSSETTRLIINFNKLARYLKDKWAQKLDLESQVRLRTSELTEANNKLKQLDAMRAQFLADVSHELRTPLTSIKGESEIRLRREDNTEEDYRSTLSRVKVMSDQMNFLVDDLLFIARSEKDTVSFQFKDSDLEGVVSSVVHNFEVLAKEQEIEFKIEWHDEPLEISMDTFRLKQALNILLDNALKFSYPKTTVRITVSSAEGNAILQVKNQGERILPEDIPYVFDRFYTGQLQQKANTSSGLGLSIAKWIIEKHNGLISLTSNEQGVTEVTISLPQSFVSEPAQKKAGGMHA